MTFLSGRVAKTLSEDRISSKSERRALNPRPKPYWRSIDQDVHLGYRKGKRGGVWVVRWYVGNERYGQHTLGVADDELQQGTLDFQSAVKAAKKHVERERLAALSNADGPPLTIGCIVSAYIAMRDERDTRSRGRPVNSDAASRLTRYIVGRPAVGNRGAIPAAPIAEIPLHDLSEDALRRWRNNLPSRLKGATKQRLVNDFRAALNSGFVENRRRLPAMVMDTIKFGLRGGGDPDHVTEDFARENQILTIAQVSSIIGAAKAVDDEKGWDGDLYRMIALLAATGARFSQIARMRVDDVQLDASRLMVPASGKGKGQKNARTPVVVGSDILDVLRPVLEGRTPSDILLQRWRSKQVKGGIAWERDRRGPWGSASELVRPWAVIRTKAQIREDLVIYALRHSSIVRGIQAMLPIQFVAKRHDTSVAMIEAHYGRYITELDELAARAVVPLVDVAA